MATKGQRIFAGFFAGLFLLTSSALTIGVIYQATQSNKPPTAASKPPPTTKPKETKLENFTPTTQPQAQLQIIDTKPGTGAEVKAGDTITADYTGALMSTGVVFDASSKHGGPATFPLSKVIAGWSQGVPGMKVGGTRRLLIPAALAYGPQAQTGIPANSDLVFDITLHKIGK
jgi:FKBP-type peptidyl-prolyl cis-trans isomerase FkpA